MTQHSTLSPERWWSSFTLDQQILMIGTEMHRAAKLMRLEDRARLQQSYERVLAAQQIPFVLDQRQSSTPT